MHRLAALCRDHLHSEPVEELFRTGHLSVVVGFRLGDGREVVVKARDPLPRLHACVEVHRWMFDRGFPCPQPLSGMLDCDGSAVTIEEYVHADDAVPASGRAPEPFARAFARLIELAPDPQAVPSLTPSPPWTRWDNGDPLWPWPDDFDGDLNLIDGPDWVDRAAQEARRRLAGYAGWSVVGHGDWYTSNLRWAGDDLAVVHDWDSVLVDTEAALVGFAATLYPSVTGGDEASLEETEGFIEAYRDARPDVEFARDDIEACWAASVWLRAFDAKKQHAKGQAVCSLSPQEAVERLRRAGSVGPTTNV